MLYSKHTNNILISMYHGTTVTIDQFDIYTLNRLFDDKYIIRNSTFGDHSVYLSDAGKAYVESLLTSQRDKKTEKFRFWIPVIISNTMSLIAIIISIIALLK